MNKAAQIAPDREANFKAQTQHYLVETRKVLKHLASERVRGQKRHRPTQSILAEVKSILYPG